MKNIIVIFGFLNSKNPFVSKKSYINVFSLFFDFCLCVGWNLVFIVLLNFQLEIHNTTLGNNNRVTNSLNPQWVHHIPLDYELGSRLKIAISIFDENISSFTESLTGSLTKSFTKKKKKEDKTTIGSATFDVGAILGSRGCSKAKRLQQGGT